MEIGLSGPTGPNALVAPGPESRPAPILLPGTMGHIARDPLQLILSHVSQLIF